MKRIPKYDERFIFKKEIFMLKNINFYLILGMSCQLFIFLILHKYKIWDGIKAFLFTRVRVMVVNTTFNNISFISWWSVLLVEGTRVPGENHHFILC
jgi:hypothetical protein